MIQNCCGNNNDKIGKYIKFVASFMSMLQDDNLEQGVVLWTVKLIQ